MARVPSSRRILLAVGVATVTLVVFWGARLWATVSGVERAGDPEGVTQVIGTVADGDRAAIRVAVEELDATDGTLPEDEPAEPYELPETQNPFTISPPLDDDMFEAILLIGADASGLRADSIILVLIPEDTAPILVSIPRDLYLENPCTRNYSRINSNLFGCGDEVSGGELLSLAVERFTGVPIDHFAMVDFEGFADSVDAVGGIDWCFDHAVRDRSAGLDAPAGCYTLDGDTALAWARSRKTQEYRDGAWHGVGASDFTRQEHQQELLFELLRKVASLDGLGSLQELAETAVENVVLSENFSVAHAVDLAWSHRDLRPKDILRIALAADPAVASSGAWVLEPTISFNALLAEVYPAAYVPVTATGD